MKIHEYQAKELFRQYKVPVPDGKFALSVDEAKEIAAGLNGFPVVVKAQIHAGGRGKGGGVKLASSIEEVETLAAQILGMTLVTRQTGPEGRIVKKLLIEAGQKIEKELYLSLLVDRATASIVIMASRDGGMNIEEVAAKTPERIIKVYIDPLMGIQGYQLRQVGFGLEIPGPVMKQFSGLLSTLYKFFLCQNLEVRCLLNTLLSYQFQRQK